MKILVSLFIFFMNGIAFAATGWDGYETKYISGRVARNYFNKALKNVDRHQYTFFKEMTKKEKAYWRRMHEQPIRPIPSKSCPAVRYVKNDVQPIAADRKHAATNGRVSGSLEVSKIPFVFVTCLETAFTSSAPKYECLLAFQFGGKSDKFVYDVNAAYQELNANESVIQLRSCIPDERDY
ncbi:MAG: hypothetical protein H7301_06795 [Cryobacterium sp.]|nr:hypothetical protein [Oligoflexia bacterium]